MTNKIFIPEGLLDNPAHTRGILYIWHKIKIKKISNSKILIGTKLSYWKAFREGSLYHKLAANDWYVKYVRLENQGTVAAIEHLLYKHNR